MTLQDVVARFNTTPFLFVGSGMTRRYYGLPNWDNLLKHFAEKLDNSRFSYRAYKSQAEEREHSNGVLPMAATLIQHDFENEWYKREELRTLDEKGLLAVENGDSPFKAEVAAYIMKNSVINHDYDIEISKLKNISKQNIAGVITTNYDLFFDKLFSEYKVFVGQDDLVFSPIQGIAEIYKIHGSVTAPDSLVINDADYQTFNQKSKYLASKLMTIFMEYPIIFMGYSISDENIRRILSDLIECLPAGKVKELQDRFVFIEREEGLSGVNISSFSFNLGEKMLSMTKMNLSDYALLYDALAAKKASIPVKILRRFKEDLYSFVLTSKPGPLLQVASLEDPRIPEEKLAITIGTRLEAEYGLENLITSNIWYRDIITDEIKDFGFSWDKVLERSFNYFSKRTSGYLPVCKALHYAIDPHPDVEARAAKDYDSIASNTIIKSRQYVSGYASAKDLWENEKRDFKKAIRILNWLPEEKMNVDELGEILREIFYNDPEILTHSAGMILTDLRRLIRFYDFLSWGKSKDS